MEFGMALRPKSDWRSGVLAVRSLPIRDTTGGLSARPF